ncbi:MAG: zeta toxin family protein [Candidatus Saccharimonas sp.]
MNTSLEEVINYCADKIVNQTKRPLFLGIVGDSGSGKSYLTKLIKEKLETRSLSCVVINHDDFLISRVDREPMKNIYYETGEFNGKSHWEVLENMFRLDDFQHVIQELKNGRCVEYHPYSRETGTVSEKYVKVCPADIIIFDTSMMIEYMDYVILVDVTQETIIKRKLIRDADVRTPDQIIDMHKRVQGYYWERARPSHADIVIDNNDFSNIHIVSG